MPNESLWHWVRDKIWYVMSWDENRLLWNYAWFFPISSTQNVDYNANLSTEYGLFQLSSAEPLGFNRWEKTQIYKKKI